MANKRLISVDGMCAWRALVIKSCFFLGDRFGDYLLKLIVGRASCNAGSS